MNESSGRPGAGLSDADPSDSDLSDADLSEGCGDASGPDYEFIPELDDVFLPIPDDGWEPMYAWSVDDAMNGQVRPAEILADCAGGNPGAGRVLMLAEIDAASLDASAQLDYLTALEAQLRWLQARRVETLATIAESDTTEDHWSVVEVARALNLADPQSGSLMADATALVGGLPATMQAFRAGRISDRAAAAVLETARTLEADQWQSLEAAVLARAPRQTVAGLRRSLLRAALRLDPQNGLHRQTAARADRHVRRNWLPDGMGQLVAFLPAAQIQAMWARLDAAARLFPSSDTRSLDQQRADLLVDAVLSGLPHDALPEMQGLRPTVNVVIDWTTLLRMNDDPADLTGYGAIPAEVARHLAGDASAAWRRFVTEPVTGHLLDYGTHTYRPPADLRDFVTNRSPVCVHPGCRQPAHRCELDHRRPYGRGGHTASDNMFPLCKRHHLAKTHGGWRYRRADDGELIFTSPTGRQYGADDDPRWRQPDEQPADAPPDRPHEPVAHSDCQSIELVPAVTQGERNEQRARERQRDEANLAACTDERTEDPASTGDAPLTGERTNRTASTDDRRAKAEGAIGQADTPPPF